MDTSNWECKTGFRGASGIVLVLGALTSNINCDYESGYRIRMDEMKRREKGKTYDCEFLLPLDLPPDLPPDILLLDLDEVLDLVMKNVRWIYREWLNRRY